jgi:hypothetical protein
MRVDVPFVRSAIPQLALDVCTDLCPGSTSSWIRVIRFQALANDPPMPLGHRNLLRDRRNAGPERLHEIDLFLDREVAEPWRRGGNYLGRAENFSARSRAETRGQEK